MRFDRDKLFATRRLRASAWLTLLSLALVQLSLASHQFDHAATDPGDSCEVCVLLERLDDAASGHTLPTAACVPSTDSVVSAAGINANLSAVATIRARAPPVS